MAMQRLTKPSWHWSVFESENGRVWKQYAFAVMESIHEKVSDFRTEGPARIRLLTEEEAPAKQLAARHFGTEQQA
jgi:hypothetical protein